MSNCLVTQNLEFIASEDTHKHILFEIVVNLLKMAGKRNDTL